MDGIRIAQSKVRGPPCFVVSGGGFCQERSALRQCCSEAATAQQTNRPLPLSEPPALPKPPPLHAAVRSLVKQGAQRIQVQAISIVEQGVSTSKKWKSLSDECPWPCLSPPTLQPTPCANPDGDYCLIKDALIQLASSVASDRESVSKAKVIKQVSARELRGWGHR